ncbi:helix-turn-helix domain-containing protein [Kitasatospora cheerisanensis]|uniref:helix-turn-helix domain-containing protein n=1 Tax=Kitasatospora cheerisanensis TaxID=81942 RepID=UPI0014312D70|nr:helix-turn-helix transcriptional regulator [Kitasatospora cheerisanensis]
MLGATEPVAAPDSGSWQEFGALLRHWRRQAGWTQAQLGAAVGYDHTAVSRLEHGARRATPRLVRRLDELLSASGELTRCYGRAETAEAERPALPAHLLRPRCRPATPRHPWSSPTSAPPGSRTTTSSARCTAPPAANSRPPRSHWPCTPRSAPTSPGRSTPTPCTPSPPSSAPNSTARKGRWANADPAP